MHRVVKLQSEIAIPKGQVNQHGKYKYRSLEDVFNKIKKPLGELGLVLSFSDSIQVVKKRIYISSEASLIDAESNKKLLSAIGFAREPLEQKGMSPAQLTGACMSYARKYALCTLLLLDDDEQIDSQPPIKEESKKKSYTYNLALLDEEKKEKAIKWCETRGIDVVYGENAITITVPRELSFLASCEEKE